MDQISADFHLLIACPGCDLLMPKVAARVGDSITCCRCGTEVDRRKKNPVDRTAALCLTGLLLFVPAMTLPIMTFRTMGMSRSGNIMESTVSYYHQGYFLVALTVLLSAVLFPFLKLSSGLAVALLIKLKRIPPQGPRLFRFFLFLEDWAMLEVYLLGIMVTVIKMYHTTDISYDLGFYCFIALVLVMMAGTAVLDKNLFWARMATGIRQVAEDDEAPQLPACEERITAMEAGLIPCDCCHTLTIRSGPDAADTLRCPLCGAKRHPRKPNSITRTWALVVTAALLFVPANILPIMRVGYFGRFDSSTIIDGIQLFFKDGSYVVGLIIFCASILVPLFKITGLLIVLLTIRFKRGPFLKQKARMLNFIDFIGRWSMLDIFVISLLCVLVRFGFFSNVQAAPAITYFCLVVITTMFAARSFDSRLLWDTCCGQEPEIEDAVTAGQ